METAPLTSRLPYRTRHAALNARHLAGGGKHVESSSHVLVHVLPSLTRRPQPGREQAGCRQDERRDARALPMPRSKYRTSKADTGKMCLRQTPRAPTVSQRKSSHSAQYVLLSPLITSRTLMNQDIGCAGRGSLPRRHCPALRQPRSGQLGMSRCCSQRRKISPRAGTRRSLLPNRCSS